MKNIINIFLLAYGYVMNEVYLQQPNFTYSAFGAIKKSKDQM